MSIPSAPLTSVVRRATTAAQAVRRRVAPRARVAWATAQRTWRRSLQLRIVTITLLTSGLLVAAVGYLVVDTIKDGILREKEADAQLKVRNGAQYAAQQLGFGTVRTDPNLPGEITTVLTQLAGTPEQGGSVIVAMLPSSSDPKDEVRSWPEEEGVRVDYAITGELRQALTTGEVAHQYVTTDLGRGAQQYLIYGTPVSVGWGQAELYYVFPLTGEVAFANLVSTTVTATGIALVVLLAVIAGLITGLVVRPVRIAARTAQRLSAGLLDQRMEVRGEDDLAMLAESFNQMADNLQRQIVRLEEMSRLQRRFTSDVSHELRTPVTTVRMAADLLFSQRANFDPAVARSAELLQIELDRFESLLTDLLEISRFDAGFAALDAEPTNFVPVVRRAADRLATIADRAGVPLELDLPDIPVIAEVDVRRVERILRNLIGNAIEHAEHRPVRITVRADQAAVAVAVRDYGVGLGVGDDKLVFNRFWRADPSRARQTGGTGLGLSISLEDARLHGGWLEAWGAPGQGAQFRLTLPVRAGDRLDSSPLRLVPPADEVIPRAEPAPTAQPVLVPSTSEVSDG